MIRRFIFSRFTLIVFAILLCILFLTKCIDNSYKEAPERIKNAQGRAYAGTESCRSCHQAVFDSFNTTMHHQASGPATKDNIKGSFKEDSNTFYFEDGQKVVMEEQPGGLLQTAYTNGQKIRSQRFDVVIGSGKRGQTYLYWRGGQLYQLPVSYLKIAHNWMNSPGFSMNTIYFDREIGGRCMECHTTYAKERLDFGYVRKDIIYGIDCERCHGPAGDHVDFHTNNPDEKLGKFIVNAAHLGRQQQMDACAICHSGVMKSMTNAFSFQTGDTLSKYFVRNYSGIDSFNLDVHANQYGLLTASKCFRLNQQMTCVTCHNPHTKETGNLTIYSQKCMSCHTTTNHNYCTLQPAPGYSLETNCVNCHMPVRSSNKIIMAGKNNQVPAREEVRSHLIAVYPDEVRKWMR